MQTAINIALFLWQNQRSTASLFDMKALNILSNLQVVLGTVFLLILWGGQEAASLREIK